MPLAGRQGQSFLSRLREYPLSDVIFIISTSRILDGCVFAIETLILEINADTNANADANAVRFITSEAGSVNHPADRSIRNFASLRVHPQRARCRYP